MTRVSAVVAMGVDRHHNHVIGRENRLLWHIPDDLKRFKALTMGHPVIMGRKTFESILSVLGRPLPGRENIVITRDPEWTSPGITVHYSLEDALAYAKERDPEEIFIGGGSQLYEQALPHIDKLYLTRIEDNQEGDSFFPAYEHTFTKKLFEEKRDWNGLSYTWIDLERE